MNVVEIVQESEQIKALAKRIISHSLTDQDKDYIRSNPPNTDAGTLICKALESRGVLSDYIIILVSNQIYGENTLNKPVMPGDQSVGFDAKDRIKNTPIKAIQWEVDIESEVKIVTFTGSSFKEGNNPDEFILLQRFTNGKELPKHVKPWDYIICNPGLPFIVMDADKFHEQYTH